MSRQKIRNLFLLISFILYPLTFFFLSPDLLLFGASEGIAAGDIVFFTVLFLSAFFFGRIFCGWICPAGALQECVSKINDKPASNRFNWIKMIIFIPWLTFFMLLVLKAGGIKHIDFLYKRAFGISIAGATEWIMYLGTAAIAFFISLFAGRRGLCHYLCWVSPFMIVGASIRNLLRLPALHLKTSPDLCTSCGICSKKCPMSLPVKELVKHGEIRHSECILCVSCVDSCPKHAITFKVMPARTCKK